MKILLICTFLFCILLCIDIKTYDNNYNEKTKKRMEKEDELLDYLTKQYESIMPSVIHESVEEVKDMDLNTEEQILEELQQKVFDRISSIIVRREEDESMLKLLDDEIIKSYVSLSLVNVDISKLLDQIKLIRYNKNKSMISETITMERVSNDTKVDSSVMDITNDLNNIFFGD